MTKKEYDSILAEASCYNERVDIVLLSLILLELRNEKKVQTPEPRKDKKQSNLRNSKDTDV